MLTPQQIDAFIGQMSSVNTSTPYMLTDKNILRDQCKRFHKAFPNTKLFYAFKAYSDKEVVMAMDTLVDGYDVASVVEIKTLLECKISTQRIYYNNPVKSRRDIQEAAALGVINFAFQSSAELAKIVQNAPRANVFLRVNFAEDTNAINLSSKFGCPVDEAMALLKEAEALALVPRGVTFHIGSQATSRETWSHATQSAHKLMSDAQKIGLKLDLLNLGGGWPVSYSDKDPSIEEIARLMPTTSPSEIMNNSYCIAAEPGRFLAAESSVIISEVIGKETRAGKTWIFLDIGTFQAFTEVFEFGHFIYPVYSVRHTKTALSVEYEPCVLTGPTCDSFDTMSWDILLPKDLDVGDQLMITMAGAYTIVYGSEFNGFKVPKRYFFDSISVRAKVKPSSMKRIFQKLSSSS